MEALINNLEIFIEDGGSNKIDKSKWGLRF